MNRWVELGTLLLVASCGVAPMAPAQISTNRSISSGHPHEREGNQAQSVIIESDKIDPIGNDRLLIFIGNVVAWQRNWRLYADRVEVYLDETDRILRATSIGNVRIATSDCQKGTGGRAEYHVLDHRVALSGNARLSRAGNVISAEDIVIYLPRASSGVSGDCAPAGDEVTHAHPKEAALPFREFL